MRKIAMIFLAAAVFTLSLSGCSGLILTPPVENPSNTAAAVTTTTTAQDTANGSTTADASPTTTTQPQISPAQQSLMNEQAKIAQSMELMGVAYLGYCEGGYAQVMDYLKNQPYSSECLYLDLITEEHFVTADGAELYAVIPAGDDVLVTVSEYSWMDENGEYAPAAGKELLSVSGRPVLLRCNISDIMSNLQITAKNSSGKSAAYNPCLSLEDGMLDMLAGGICDLTPYEKMPQFNAVDPVPDSVFCGTWFCEARDGNNDIRTMILSLYPDGGAEYSYGIGNSEILEFFAGTWSDNGTMLTLDMHGGPVSTEGAGLSGDTYDTTVHLEWHMTAEGLELTHIAGNVLLYGTENDTFVFSSMY